MNATTGEVLFDRNATAPNSTGSVLKVLTAAAGLSALGPDYRFTTKVVEGSAPGSIVLVGGGDVTLARDGDNVYPEAPSLQALADQVQGGVGGHARRRSDHADHHRRHDVGSRTTTGMTRGCARSRTTATRPR